MDELKKIVGNINARITCLHQPDTCSCHPQHMQVNCVLDSTPHCSSQPDKESDGPFVPFEHLTVSGRKKKHHPWTSFATNPLQPKERKGDSRPSIDQILNKRRGTRMLTISMNKSSLAEAMYSPVWLKLIVLTGHLRK